MKKQLPDILQKILASKREEIAALKASGLAGGAADQPRTEPSPRGFLQAIKACPLTPVIAEIKRRSPSAGALGAGVDPTKRARLYQKGGAACISVLTDHGYFGGSFQDLAEVRQAVDLPVLCKDFILDEAQIIQARSFGADAVLLIAAALEPAQMKDLYQAALGLGLDVLLEVHEAPELEGVLSLEPSLVGVNNRDLRRMTVDPEHCLSMRRLIPPEVTVVAESGVSRPEQIRRLLAGGLDAFLIGTALMRADDPAGLLTSLTGVESD